MANCYLCGRPIYERNYNRRRRVKTGEHERRRYPPGKVVAIQVAYGMRIVCPACAKFIDRQKVTGLLLEHLSVLFALATLFIVLLSHMFR